MASSTVWFPGWHKQHTSFVRGRQADGKFNVLCPMWQKQHSFNSCPRPTRRWPAQCFFGPCDTSTLFWKGLHLKFCPRPTGRWLGFCLPCDTSSQALCAAGRPMVSSGFFASCDTSNISTSARGWQDPMWHGQHANGSLNVCFSCNISHCVRGRQADP